VGGQKSDWDVSFSLGSDRTEIRDETKSVLLHVPGILDYSLEINQRGDKVVASILVSDLFPSLTITPICA
jgi:hypothetical protein